MLQFGLVSFPVEAFNAHNTEMGQISLHQLHANCHSRIHYQKVCPIHGPVPNDEIISGYEVSKGKYVEIDPDETIVPPATVSGSDKKVKLAEQLIESWTDKSFDFSKYEDTHLKGMRALIEAKLEGREIVAPEVEETPEVINLMDALKKSIGKGGHVRSVQAAVPRTRRESARKKGRRAP
jgi:non-homologous end joining protein Ku